MPDLTGPVMTDLGPTDRCPRCDGLRFVEPVMQIFCAIEVRHVYECPECRHGWWNAYNTASDNWWETAA